MMKLNCDLGELSGDLNHDALIMPFIDQANIACGFHASSPLIMQQTVALAVKHNVAIGAHPSYPDKENFGRLSMTLSDEDLIATLHYQIGALQAICLSNNTYVAYVKPHGALYNDMMANLTIFNIICKALAQLDNQLVLMIQALPNTKEFERIAKRHQITLWYEAFADRTYQYNGLLVPRTKEGVVNHDAIIDDTDQILTNTKQLIEHKTLCSITGEQLTLQVDTLCVHGDNQSAIQLINALRMFIDDLA